MQKRMIAVLAAMLAMSGVRVSAQSYKFVCEAEENEAVAIFEDENNMVFDVRRCTIEVKDKIACTEDMEISAAKVSFVLPKSRTLVTELIEEKAEEPTEGEDKNDGKENGDNNIHPAYPTAKDMATAFMMVKTAKLVFEDSSTKLRLEVLFRGEEQELTLEEDMTLSSVPIANSQLAGESVFSLKAGDIIYCTTNLSGKLRGVELIFRPTDSDVITSDEYYGRNFEALYTTDGADVTISNPVPGGIFGGVNSKDRRYAFGAVKEVGQTYLTLCNKAGIEAQNINVDITSDTIVYVYDKSKKSRGIRIGDISDIAATSFDTGAEDDRGNVIDWTKTFERNYALVRMTDGTATEVAVFLNY